MNELAQRKTAIFVVRLWVEYLTQSPPEWRGEILHPESGQAILFQQPDRLHAFMVSCAVEQGVAGVEASRQQESKNPGE